MTKVLVVSDYPVRQISLMHLAENLLIFGKTKGIFSGRQGLAVKLLRSSQTKQKTETKY